MAENTISFAQEVKEEIASYEWEDVCKRSLLSSYIKNNGHIKISGGKEELALYSENAKIAKALYSFISELYGVNVRFAYSRSMGARKKVKYHILIDDAEYILGDLEIDFLQGKIPHNSVANDSLAAAYLAGGFLASGSVNDPKTSNYHLEISFSDAAYAKWFCHLLNKINDHQFNAKLAKRRQQWIVYIKRSDSIANFLVLVGAQQSCLKFEDVRIGRDFSNIGNRLQNLDGANFGKTMNAAKRQLEEINYLVEHIGYERIDNPKMEALMELRLSHEDATMSELAEMLSEEFATTITKSNINHLFRSIHEMYSKESNGQ